jgi:NAD(P)-dependent dehydrogenase (short-subunit alcohol dehydrogenase family)
MSLYSMLAPRGANGFGYGSTAEDVTANVDLHGKTILVTGCNSGLGLETMRVLRKRGAHVIGTARTKQKADDAAASLGSQSGPFTGAACELSDPKSVRWCVAEIQSKGTKLDAIIANAGIMALPKLETAHGLELQFFTNHVGHFLLVTGLLDQLTDKGRVVITSSEAHRRAYEGGVQLDNLDGKKGGYTAWGAYGQSKMANILFAKKLAKKLEGTGKTANALHPGVIKTNLTRHSSVAAVGMSIISPLVLKNVAEGAATQTFLAVSPKADGISGKYFTNCQELRPRREADDAALADALWAKTEEIVAKLPA